MTKEQKPLPALRFPEFDGDWELHKLGEFIDERKDVASSELPLYSLTIESGIVPKSKRYERSFLVKSEDAAYKRMKPKDFAYNPMNLRWGALACHHADKEVAVSKYYDVFSVNEKSAPEYLEPFLTSYRMVQFYDRMSTGTLEEKKRVHYLDFVHFKKLFPTLPEQRKIADFLTAVDGRIQQLIQKKALLEDYKKGVMQQIFTQAIRFKDDHGNDFPDWEEKKLGKVCSILKGKGISKAEVAEDGATPCIRYGELYTEYSELIQEPKSRTDVPTKELVLSLTNDVIIPASGETHIDIATASCVMSEGIALGGDLNIIRTKLNGVFLAYYLNNACKHAIARVAQGSSVIHLYPDQLKGLTLAFPSPDEQAKIAGFLSAIDRKVESVTAQITETQTFKRGLLQQMFV